MKIFRLLLFAVCLLTNFRLYAQQSQTITLALKEVPLETVLAQIKKQTGISFFYNEDILKAAGKISIQAEKVDLQTALKLCLRNTPIKYNLIGNIVVLTDKNNATDPDGQPIIDKPIFSRLTAHGYVYNESVQSLAGANVIIKRTRQGVGTNARGEFTLENVRSNDTLSISFIGYAPQDVPVLSQTEFNIGMKETKNVLDEVLVQAYGTTSKRLMVGEISQINAKQIENQPLTNPIIALQSMVPGLLITPTSGNTGAPVKVEIRGRNTIDPNVTSDPLYIIDGVPLITPNISPFSTGSYQNGSPGFQQSGLNAGQSPFFSLNPGDIESISVLKDGAATAMYGSRAGNGVILITTKKGKPGATQFNVNVNQSITRAIGYWDMLNTSQYLQMRNEAFKNDGITPTITNAPDLKLWDTSRDIDWQKELLQTGKNTDIQTSLSGGNNLTTFRIGAAYNAIQDISALRENNKNEKATVNLNFTHRSPNQKLSIIVSAIYAYTNTKQINDVGASTLSPDLPPIFDKNGNLNYAPWNASGMGFSFPFSALLTPSLANSYFLNSNININYQILNGLNASLGLGYNNVQGKNSYTTTIASQNPLFNPQGQLILGDNKNVGWNINPQLTYSRYINKGKLEATLGGTLNGTAASGLTLVGFGYTSDELLKSINNAANQISLQAYTQNKYMDVHARINYNWENKYIVEFVGNRDGSSSFGPGRQFGNFWSAGVNWIASEEKWLKKSIPEWVSLVKFNSSYGTTGVSSGDYQYLSQWASSLANAGTPLYNYNGRSPLIPIHAENQDYQWQTTKQLNVGMDLGFLNDRFNLHVAYYQKRCADQLSLLPTPVFTGFANVLGNSKADVQNTGWEGNLFARIITNKNFTWSASFNISANRNKLLDFPDIEFTPYYTTLKIGQSINNVYLLHYQGIDTQTGQRSYVDFNRDGLINQNGNGPAGSGLDDRYIAIDPSPDFFGGAGTDLRYKNLTLSLNFSFEKGLTRLAYPYTAGKMLNIPTSVFEDHWQKPGDIASNPRFTTTDGLSDALFSQSDGAYTDGSFLRLQTVGIGYVLPDRYTKYVGAKGVNLAISMQNIFTLTNYDGIDPKAIFGSKPQPKVFNAKVVFNF